MCSMHIYSLSSIDRNGGDVLYEQGHVSGLSWQGVIWTPECGIFRSQQSPLMKW